MKAGSCFSGIDGFGLGLEWAGIETCWQIENDPFCIAVLEKNWPEVARYGDICTVKGGDLESVDLIYGGFPCQPFSHAGKRGGQGDNRYLWPEMLRLVRECRPAFVLAENVYGLVTNERGMAIETVYLDLEAAGYEVAPPVVFPAAAVGALHRRDRVWICAHDRHDRRRSAEYGAEQEEWAEGNKGVSIDTDQPRCSNIGSRQVGVRQEPDNGDRAGGIIANSDSDRRRPNASCAALDLQNRNGNLSRQAGRWADENANNNSVSRIQRVQFGSPEPDVGRMVYGLAARSHERQLVEARLKALGNSVVPQAAYQVGLALMAAAR